MKTYTLNADGKKIGRVASEAAKLIMGKNTPEFARNEIPDVTVIIENASKVNLTEKKRASMTYQNYSGYPGGLKTLSAAQVIERKGYRELFRKAVFGMLPTNRLRPRMIKKLVIKE